MRVTRALPAKSKRAAKSAPKIAGENQTLYDALKAVRLKLASAAKLPPYVIAQDRTLIELAEKRPQKEDALHEITGLGSSKIARYGKAFLDCIAGYKKHPLLTNRLSSTVNQTLAAHLRGLDAEAIATERGIEASTVYGHFAEAIEAGLLDAKDVLRLDASDIDEIESAFEACHTLETGKLGAAHARLEGRYDYGILKCMLMAAQHS